MSTDPTGTTPPAATPAEPVTPVAPAEPAPAPAATTDEVFSSGDDDGNGDGNGSGEEPESFFGRYSALLVSLMAAIVVVAAAVAGLTYYRAQMEDDNTATEQAFRQSVQERGASVETVECDGDTCAAVIGGSAYTVLVQEDEDGEQHFGVATFTGD
jgi:hypothetical protein